MRPNKNSAFIKVALAIILFYSVYSFCFFFYQAAVGREVFNSRRTELLIDQMHISALYMKANDLKNMKLYLNDRIKAHDLDFYLIGKEASYEQVNMRDTPLDVIIGTPKNGLTHIESGTRFDKLEVVRLEEAGSTLIMGNNLGPINYFSIILKDNQDKILGDIGFVLLSILGIVVFYFRDIGFIYRALLSRDRSAFKNMKANSAESDLFLGAIGGYEKILQSTFEVNSSLERQVLSGIQKELKSGKKPPYNFSIVMARTDINQFSTIFNRYDREAFMALINAFFLDCTNIIDRYDGLVHEYAGDEIIYYFKQEDDVNPFLLALGAIREINAKAEEYSLRAQNEGGYRFTVKSSLAHGELRFGKLVNSYTVAGAPFIETVRILSEINEKNINTLYFSEDTAEQLKKVSELRFEKSVFLKGYDYETKLFSFQRMKHLSFLQEQLPLLAYRRSEEEILAIFAWLMAKDEQITTKDFLTVARCLKSNRVGAAWKSTTAEYLELLKKHISDPSTDSESYRLSAILGLATSFVEKNNYSLLKPYLEDCLHHSDRRVISNALDLLSQYDPDFKISSIGAEDHRITAAILAKDGIANLSEANIKKIRKFLHAENAVQVASALFAIGTIANHYRLQDPVYLSTRLTFLHLLNQLPEFVLSKHAMVSRQALVAAKKYNDATILQAIREIFQATSDPAMIKLFDEVLSWKKSDIQKSTTVKRAA